MCSPNQTRKFIFSACATTKNSMQFHAYVYLLASFSSWQILFILNLLFDIFRTKYRTLARFPGDPRCSKKYLLYLAMHTYLKLFRNTSQRSHSDPIQYHPHIPISYQLPVSTLGSYFFTFVIVLLVLLLSLFFVVVVVLHHSYTFDL